MKKIIAAALSLLVGAFGFTIVDKTLELRVADLECSVSSLEERLNTTELSKTTNQTVAVHFELPLKNETGTITATLDGEQFFSEDEYLNGNDYSLLVTGSIATSEMKVFVDGALLFRCNIDFTAYPVRVYNVESYEIYVSVPETVSNTIEK